MGMVVFAPAGGIAQVNPIGSLIAYSGESLLIDKGLQVIYPMAIAVLPVGGYLPDGERQQVRSEIFDLDPGQYQKSAVIGHVAQIFFPDGFVPSDKAIPTTNVAGRR